MNEERESCLNALRSMNSFQFERVIEYLQPQGLTVTVLPGPSAPQYQRAIELLRWAESPSGCGLVLVRKAIDYAAIFFVEDCLREELGEIAGRIEHVHPLESWEPIDPTTFYRIAPVTWSYIAATIDAKRSLYEEVWPEITGVGPTCGVWCIRGEPLSGKSTFARRLAYDLASQHQVVIRVKEGQNHPEIWNRLPYFCSSVDRVVYALVDDDFADRSCRNALRGCVEAICNEGSLLRVIVTCTSDPFVDALRGLPLSRKELTLSAQDKHELLSKIGLDEDAIGGRAFDELMSLERFYAFLAESMELKEGRGLRPLQDVESDRVAYLRVSHPRVYLALKYVCFIHQFGLNVPVSLLDQLQDGVLTGVLSLDEAPNYIFATPDSEIPMVQAGHPSLARAYWQVYARSTSPQEVLRTLIIVARPKNSRECVFIMHLMRECVNSPDIGSFRVAEFITDHADRLGALQELVGVEHLLAWRAIHKRIGQSEAADRCLALARIRRPVNVPDAIVQANLIRKQEPERALDLLGAWRTKFPDNRALKVAYLGAVQESFPEASKTVTAEPYMWLQDPSSNSVVVSKFIELLSRVPDTETSPLITARDILSGWLKECPDHPATAALWISYLKLCEVHRDAGDLHEEMLHCWKWLIEHRDRKAFPLAAHFLAGLLIRYGTEEEKGRFLKDLLGYLNEHPGAGHVLVAYFNLLKAGVESPESFGIVERIEEHLLEIHHPYTLANFLSIVPLVPWEIERKRQLINKLRQWLGHPLHLEDDYVRTKYLNCVRHWGNQDQVDKAIEETRAWLVSHDDDVIVRTAYLTLIEHRRRDRLDEAVQEAIEWMRQHLDAKGIETVQKKLDKIMRAQFGE